MTTPNASLYLNLNIRAGAPVRLAHLRAAAAYTNAPDVNPPPSLRLADWRAARKDTFLSDFRELCTGYNTASNGTKINVWSTFSAPNFRDERNADDIEGARIKHRGWFADADCSNTVRGIVGRLTRGRFIAGYKVSDTGEHVYMDSVFSCEVLAGLAADEFARQYAEKEKEHDERWQAAHKLNDDCYDLMDDIKELIPMRHHARARRELHKAIDDLRTKRADLGDNYADIEF